MSNQSRKPIHRFSLLLAGIALGLVLAESALAQLPTATIFGVVKDSSGAVVPSVAVTVTNTETGMTRSSQTGNDGMYRFPALPVGNYQVRAEHPGFQTRVQSGLRLTVGQEAVLNFTLEVGSVTETVSVTAEAPMVNTVSGTLGSLVNEQTVSDLPLNGRNYTDLALLQTGVSINRSTSTAGNLNGLIISINGAPTRSNLYTMDGTIVNDAHNLGPSSASESALGVEGIREYRVVTNAFSAEYGLTMGSQITLVTKSGTNELHGSLFEYLRNSALDARNWTDIPDKPAFRRNNFGASLGGPIRTDKLFYHMVYEGLRQSRGDSHVGTVPSVAARQDGGLVPKIAESVKPYLALYPLPNGPDLGQGLARYFYALTTTQSENFGQGRIDWNISSSDTLFGRYTITKAETVAPQSLFPEVVTGLPTKNQWLTLSENHIFSPSLLATFRASFSRTLTRRNGEGIINPALTFVPGEMLGGLGISGVDSWGADPQSGLMQRIISFSDDMFYTRGRHSLKFGALINLYRHYLLNNAAGGSGGSWSFANLAAFLEARPTSFTFKTPGSIFDRTYDYETMGFYLQDDLRVTPTITLNLGLRYEFSTQVEEIRGNGAALRDVQRDPNTTPGIPFINPSKRNISPRFGFAWDVRGDGKTALRGGFGLLYDIGVFATSLHVGASATPPLSSNTELTPARGLVFGPNVVIPPGLGGRQLRTVDYNMQQPHLLSYNLAVDRQLPFDMGLIVAYAGSRGINLNQVKEGNPTVPQGSPQGGSCVAVSPPPAFVPDGPKCWLAGSPRTNPNWGTMDYRTAGGNSWYNGLQVGLRKRFSSGLQFQSSYTWSHALDETQGQIGVDNSFGGGGVGDDPSNRRHDKGSAAFDVRHNWRFNTIYRFPSNLTGGWGKLGNGWWVSGILSLNSGTPFQLTMSTQRSRSGTAGANGGMKRPDLVAGVKHEDITRGTSRGCLGVEAGTPIGTSQLFYDPCAFAIPPLGFLGTAGSSIVYGPNFSDVAFSLGKDTPLPFLGEAGSLQFRAEFFNIFNHPSLGIPDRSVFTARADSERPRATAGQITSTVSESREIQFALKILF
ncbi:MAG: TonB-dependent receptor [Acidobacteria bacterium]|nr:TonB-dependent receptor [Acidobacteriota bacterium]